MSKQTSPTQQTTNPYAADAQEGDPYDYDYQPFSAKETKKGLLNENGTATASADFEDESIKMKALELARREAELERREAALKTGAPGQASQDANYQKPNWPRCYPLVYHNIGKIDNRLRRGIVVMGYIGFFIFSALCILNFIGAMLSISPFFAMENTKNDIDNMQKAKFGFMAGMIMIISIPAHFFLSYWSLYKSMEGVALLRMLIFFILYALPILFCAFGFAGWYEYGVCGLILIIQAWPPFLKGTGNNVIWTVNVIMAALWVLMGVYFFLIYILGIVVFRRESYTLKKAKEVLQSEVVKGVTSTIQKGVSTAMSASKE